MRAAAKVSLTAHPVVDRATDLRLTGDRLVRAAVEVEAAIIRLAFFGTEGQVQPQGISFAWVEER